MQIGELSARSGVSARSLRHYERLGLITAGRGSNGYRDFDDPVVDRARTIHLLFGLGIDRALVTAVLACAGDATAEAHRATREQLVDVRDQMAERIVELTAAHAAVSSIVDRIA